MAGSRGLSGKVLQTPGRRALPLGGAVNGDLGDGIKALAIREQGQHRYYRLEPAQLAPIAEWLGAFVKPVVAAAEPVAEETAAVAAATPERPVPPRLRAVAVQSPCAAQRGGAMTGSGREL